MAQASVARSAVQKLQGFTLSRQDLRLPALGAWAPAICDLHGWSGVAADVSG